MADVVVVEDDSAFAEAVADVLASEGHTVRIAQDGDDGLKLLAQRVPDLIVLDVEMPVLTGPEMALRMFLDDCGQEEIPILLLSGVKDLGAVAARVGTPYFLGKPFAVDAKLHLRPRLDMHLLGNRGGDAKCETVTPL